MLDGWLSICGILSHRLRKTLRLNYRLSWGLLLSQRLGLACPEHWLRMGLSLDHGLGMDLSVGHWLRMGLNLGH